MLRWIASDCGAQEGKGHEEITKTPTLVELSCDKIYTLLVAAQKERTFEWVLNELPVPPSVKQQLRVPNML
jgi:hypothetical protein